MRKGCLVPGCGAQHHGQGYCRNHYRRWKDHGDPLAGRVVHTGTAIERFHASYVVQAEGANGLSPCWTWQLALTDGYGRIKTDGHYRSAHKFGYEQMVGPLPEGTVPDHLCHTLDLACAGGDSCPHRSCVNPEHIEPVSNQENVLRGRTVVAANAAKTHCVHGHEFTEDNIYHQNGGRSCRKCRALRDRQYKDARKARA